MARQILIVDDSDTIRRFMTITLRAAGFQVCVAGDGMEALEKLTETPADLIITDLNMPIMDGYELVRALRADDAYRDVPVIVLSSLAGEDSVCRCKALGADSFLQKPFNGKRVQFEVSKYLN